MPNILQCDCPPKDMEAAEYLKQTYQNIGQHIIDHADELSAGVTDYTAGIELKIQIQPTQAIMLENKVGYFVLKKDK